MKKFILILFGTFLLTFKAYATFPDLTPLSQFAPQLCAQCTASHLQTLQSAVSVVNQIKNRDGREQLLTETVGHLEKYAFTQGNSLLNKYLNKLNGQKDDGKPISYTRMIKKTRTNLNDVAAVKDSFGKYFLYVPSNNEEIQASYKDKREQFVEDTTLELYITAKEMDAELKVMISQLDLIQQCLIMGDVEKCKAEGLEQYNCQQEGAEDEMCYRRNALLVADIYDTIMKYNEYLMAMRAQYEAVRTLGQGAKPKPYSPESKKTSSLESYQTFNSAFAAQEVENESLVLDKLPENKYEFQDGNETGMKTFLSDKKDDLLAPALFQDVQEQVSTALNSHNLKKMLPEIKESFISYHDMINMHEKSVKDLQASQECVLNYLSQRYADSQKVWLDNCTLVNDGYVCAYNPAKSVTDNSESEGLYDTLCPNNPSQKCYKLAPSAYNEIGGMSGWLINLYLNAKDDLADTDVHADDYVIAASDSATEANKPVGPGNDANMSKDMKKQVENDKVLADTYAQKMRTLSRLPFSIGAKANEEINNDTNSGASKFKVATKPFALWNDQKNFYNLYIDGKYDNIIKYFESAPLYEGVLNLGLEINKSYNYADETNAGGIVTKSAEAIRKEIAQVITNLLTGADIDRDSRVEKVKEILAEEKTNLQKISETYKQQLKELDQQRVDLYRQLQELNVKEADLNAEVEKQNSVITYAEGFIEPAEFAADLDKQYQTKANPHKTNEEVFRENIAVQNQNELEAEKARAAAKRELNSVSKNKNALLDKIKAHELKIKKLRALYVLTYYNAEQKYKVSIDDATTELELNEAQNAIAEAIKSVTVLGEAEEIMEYMRQYAIKKVAEAKQQIDELKTNKTDSLYYAKNNAEVVRIHSDMIKKITEPDVNDVVEELGLDEDTAAILAAYAGSLTSAFSDICDGVSCNQPDSEYFVGMIGQKRDMAAPKAAVDFSSAPMREIFNFAPQDLSYIDYYAGKNFTLNSKSEIVDMGNEPADITQEGVKVLLIKNSLPDSQIELPEIWKIVLSYRPFVEKDLDLRSFLNHGKAESFALARSGIYPCMVGSKIIDVAPDDFGNISYVETDVEPLGYSKLPQCRTIAANESGYYDTQASTDDNKIRIKPAVTIPDLEASELGNILEYADMNVNILGVDGLPLTDEFGTIATSKQVGYLTFRKELLSSLRFIKSYIEDFEEGEDMAFNAEYYLYDRVFPQNNQLGDYLIRVDLERAALEGREKVKNSLYGRNIDDNVIVNSLYKSFVAMGYDFDREKFDLSDDNYYQQASNILNARKEEALRKAKELIADKRLNSLSEEMNKRKEKLQKQISLLEIDADEEVLINGMETEEELAESIKTARADKAIMNKELDKGKAHMKETLSQSEAPYCSVYHQ